LASLARFVGFVRTLPARAQGLWISKQLSHKVHEGHNEHQVSVNEEMLSTARLRHVLKMSMAKSNSCATISAVAVQINTGRSLFDLTDLQEDRSPLARFS
jgi:hypothetical protein